MMNKYYFKKNTKDAHSEEKAHRKKPTRSKPNLTKNLIRYSQHISVYVMQCQVDILGVFRALR